MSRHQIVRDTNLIKTGVDTRSPEEKKRAQQYKDSDGDRHRQLDSECDRITSRKRTETNRVLCACQHSTPNHRRAPMNQHARSLEVRFFEIGSFAKKFGTLRIKVQNSSLVSGDLLWRTDLSIICAGTNFFDENTHIVIDSQMAEKLRRGMYDPSNPPASILLYFSILSLHDTKFGTFCSKSTYICPSKFRTHFCSQHPLLTL